MEKTIQELNLSMTAQVANFRQRWDVMRVRIVTLDGADIGWLQSVTQDGSLFLAQFVVDATFQRQGIGSEVINRLIHEAAVAGQAVTLGVAKKNPALRLYEQLGFRVTHADDRKFYMRRQPEDGVPVSN
jgi:ribosomal protein S18 acetylase RimI-like enzyme